MSVEIDQKFEGYFEVFRHFVPDTVAVHYREEFGRYTVYAIVNSDEERREVDHAHELVLAESRYHPWFDLYVISLRHLDKSKTLLRGTKKVKGLKKTR